MKIKEMTPPQTIESAVQIMDNEKLPEETREIAKGYIDGIDLLSNSESNATYYSLGVANSLYTLLFEYTVQHGPERGQKLQDEIINVIKKGL
jgi:hypothetical protein